ncbi:MAG: hypothetical protein ACTHNW_02885 [Mucilaginibacter sp.]
MPAKKLELRETGNMGYIRDIQYNCRQATFLIEKRMIRKLTFRETIELRIHLTGCSVCVLYDKQSRAINQMVKRLLNQSEPREIKLDDSFKHDLQERIEEELNKN